MTTLPPPLTPPESELRDFPFMPLDVVRFARSDLVAFEDPAAVVAALLLWGASWHQTPAGSLTNDDRALANLAGYGRGVAAFQAIKDAALRGFVECSDGRLYHPVVAEKVRAAWLGKLKQRWRTYCAAIRQHNTRHENDQRQAPAFEDWLEQGQPTTVVRGARSPVQEALPLADRDNVTRDNAHESRVTTDNVTRDKGGESRESHTENRSKGEGEGEREGDSKEQSPPTPSTDIWSGDLLQVTNQLAKRAGISMMRPTNVTRNMDVVKAWRADGVDLEAVVVPIIERDTLDHPDQPRHSLLYYDGAVRKALAVKGVTANRKPAAKPGPPPPPLTTQDDPDPRIVTIRERLRASCGAKLYENWFDPKGLAFTVADGIVRVVTRADFMQAWIREHYRDRLDAMAKDLGFEGATV